MAGLTETGCGTPQDPGQKQVFLRLVELFSPVVLFEPEERFFPVDLPTTIAHSQLWRADTRTQPPTAQRLKDFGTIDPQVDLTVAGAFHFTTVAGVREFEQTIADYPPRTMPAPDLDEVLARYQTGAITAELTVYASVCIAHDVDNSGLLSACRDKAVQHGMAEGLILNYFFYFPACESPQWDAEGDWSGVSLLLRERPPGDVDLSQAEQVERYLPVLACYFHKALDGTPPIPHLVAGQQGFRRWLDVKRAPEATLGGLPTHPLVYVSRGRHNCYYGPVHTPISLNAPWAFRADVIERAQYVGGGPAVNTLKGGGIEEFPGWGYAFFPPFALFVACATGCDYPVHFDTSAPPMGYEKGDDTAGDGGFQGLPASQGSPYPTSTAKAAPPWAPLGVNLRIRYVDLSDATMAALWGYGGAWGAATVHKGTPPLQWGYYRGARRPRLSAWFVWNLFLNDVYGCNGIPQVTRSPW